MSDLSGPHSPLDNRPTRQHWDGRIAQCDAEAKITRLRAEVLAWRAADWRTAMNDSDLQLIEDLDTMAHEYTTEAIERHMLEGAASRLRELLDQQRARDREQQVEIIAARDAEIATLHARLARAEAVIAAYEIANGKRDVMDAERLADQYRRDFPKEQA